MLGHKKIFLLTTGTLLILFGIFFLVKVKIVEKPITTIDIHQDSMIEQEDSVVLDVPSALDEPLSENPGDQKDVTDRPVYLIDVYTEHGKKYIGVDYVIPFEGDAALQAQVEDGLCKEQSDCTVYPNGYLRNVNPHYRTFEISTTTPLTIEVSSVLNDALQSRGLDTTSPTFEQLQEVIGTIPPFASTTFPFKDPKSFVYIDIIGGAIIKIREP